MESGWYYVKVSEKSGLNCNFQLRGFVEIGGGAQDDFEDDDSLMKSRYAKIAETQARTFHDSNDCDWTAFFAIQSHKYRIRTYDELNGADTSLAVYDQNSNVVVAETNENSGGQGEQIEFYAPVTAVLFVKISNVSENFSGKAKYLRI